MATPVTPMPTEENVPMPKSKTNLKNCWSCRVICGSGLILSGAYVFNAARKVMRLGEPTTLGKVLQLTFAAGLAAWGVVVITDPVGKAQREA
ncbi:distal membrane-arm assembly complex protein 1-like [Vanacampus margaritifer]